MLIMAGKIDAEEKKEMNITLTIMADRLLKMTTVFLNVVAGCMSLNTYTRISCKVKILGIYIFV